MDTDLRRYDGVFVRGVSLYCGSGGAVPACVGMTSFFTFVVLRIVLNAMDVDLRRYDVFFVCGVCYAG